jgi:hypothetical protein
MLSQRKYSGQLTLSLPGQRCRCRKKIAWRHLHPLSELKTCSTRVTNPVNYGIYETASFLHLTITICIRFSELAPWQSNPLAIERIEHDVARRIRPRL